MRYSTLFFDLDDTLYPPENGLWEAIKERISLYMAVKLNLPAGEIPDLRLYYYNTYGTTMRGLQIHFGIDPREYLDFVHDLPLENFLDPDPELGSLLNSLPQKRWIFTNADADHARRVLDQLAIQDCFAGIIDVLAMDYACKPDLVAYQRALDATGAGNAAQCMLFDDTDRNLIPARRLGFSTVRVGAHPGSNRQPGPPDQQDRSMSPEQAGGRTRADTFHLPEIHLLREYLPLLWDGG